MIGAISKILLGTGFLFSLREVQCILLSLLHIKKVVRQNNVKIDLYAIQDLCSQGQTEEETRRGTSIRPVCIITGEGGGGGKRRV